MLDAAKEAMEFCEGKTRSDLESDRKLTLAVLKELEIIGEAATRVTEETRKRWPGIPWEDIVGMRNRLIHGYFDVNYDIVWRTIMDDIPQLEAQLREIVEKLSR